MSILIAYNNDMSDIEKQAFKKVCMAPPFVMLVERQIQLAKDRIALMNYGVDDDTLAKEYRQLRFQLSYWMEFQGLIVNMAKELTDVS